MGDLAGTASDDPDVLFNLASVTAEAGMPNESLAVLGRLKATGKSPAMAMGVSADSPITLSDTLAVVPPTGDLNADLAEALFSIADSHPPGEMRLALLRAAYAVFDHARELDGARLGCEQHDELRQRGQQHVQRRRPYRRRRHQQGEQGPGMAFQGLHGCQARQ